LLILAIETSNVYLSIAVEKDGEVLLDYSEKVPMRHSEIILPIITELFTHLKIQVPDLDRIGVSIGPGMFTALRIGLALTKGLAFPYKIPVVPVNTLDGLALPYLGLADYVMPITDARRGLLYTAQYSNDGIQTEYLLIKPEDFHTLIKGPTIIIGDGVNRYQKIIESLKPEAIIPEPNPSFPDARIIAQLARRGEPVPIDRLEPFYLKKSDAEIDNPEKDAH